MQIMTSSPIQGQGQSWGLEPRSEWQPSMRTAVQMWMIYDNYGYWDIHNLENKTFTETLLLNSTKQTNLSKVRTTKNYIPLGNKYRGYNDKRLNREKIKEWVSSWRGGPRQVYRSFPAEEIGCFCLKRRVFPPRYGSSPYFTTNFTYINSKLDLRSRSIKPVLKINIFLFSTINPLSTGDS